MDPNKIYQLMRPEEIEAIQVKSMSDEQRSKLLEWVLRMVAQNNPTEGDIASIKYSGRLVILDDGSRWEVDETDAFTTEMWMETDRVIILHGDMYKLDDGEKVAVEQEF